MMIMVGDEEGAWLCLLIKNMSVLGNAQTIVISMSGLIGDLQTMNAYDAV